MLNAASGPGLHCLPLIPVVLYISKRLDLRRVGNILSLRFDHEIFFMIILSQTLIQEGQLSVPVSGKRMYTILVNRLED